MGLAKIFMFDTKNRSIFCLFLALVCLTQAGKIINKITKGRINFRDCFWDIESFIGTKTIFTMATDQYFTDDAILSADTDEKSDDVAEFGDVGLDEDEVDGLGVSEDDEE